MSSNSEVHGDIGGISDLPADPEPVLLQLICDVQLEIKGIDFLCLLGRAKEIDRLTLSFFDADKITVSGKTVLG